MLLARARAVRRCFEKNSRMPMVEPRGVYTAGGAGSTRKTAPSVSGGVGRAAVRAGIAGMDQGIEPAHAHAVVSVTQTVGAAGVRRRADPVGDAREGAGRLLGREAGGHGEDRSQQRAEPQPQAGHQNLHAAVRPPPEWSAAGAIATAASPVLMPSITKKTAATVAAPAAHSSATRASCASRCPSARALSYCRATDE